jgi:uncharacterized C2H2 Zn-finger protein
LVGGDVLGKKMKCPGCGAEFDSYDMLIDHVVKVHESNCQMCGAVLNSKEELLKHNKEVHGV